MAIYGYARVSTKTQRLDRQMDNITNAFPNVKRIYAEKYTGTKVDGRIEFQKLLKTVKKGDTIVFDSVSRMSRNAEEGILEYFDLFDKGIILIFLKERYIDTDIYKSSIEKSIADTDNEIANIYIQATNKVIRLLAKQQIEKAFEQAEKEVLDTRKRVSEGMQATKRKNLSLPIEEQTQIGQKKGIKLTTKKSIESKEQIKKYCKEFNGTLNDIECMQLLRLSRNTYYKYKRELKENV